MDAFKARLLKESEAAAVEAAADSAAKQQAVEAARVAQDADGLEGREGGRLVSLDLMTARCCSPA